MASAKAPAGAWKLDGAQEGLSSLKYEPAFSARAEHLGPEDVLVDFYAASLNYRDIAITKVLSFSVHCNTAEHQSSDADHSTEGKSTRHHPPPRPPGRHPRLRRRGRRRRRRIRGGIGRRGVAAVAPSRRAGRDAHGGAEGRRPHARYGRGVRRPRPGARRDAVPEGRAPPLLRRAHAIGADVRRGGDADVLGPDGVECARGPAGPGGQEGGLGARSGDWGCERCGVAGERCLSLLSSRLSCSTDICETDC